MQLDTSSKPTATKDYTVGLMIGAYNKTAHDEPVTYEELFDVYLEGCPLKLHELMEQSHLRGYQQGLVDGMAAAGLFDELSGVHDAT